MNKLLNRCRCRCHHHHALTSCPKHILLPFQRRHVNVRCNYVQHQHSLFLCAFSSLPFRQRFHAAERKHQHQEGQSSEWASKWIAAMRSSMTTSTPVVSPTHTLIPDTPLSRCPNLSLHPINNSSTNMPESSPFTPHCPKPASPAPTEIAYDISHNIEQSPKERIDSPSSRDQSPQLCVRADAQFQQSL